MKANHYVSVAGIVTNEEENILLIKHPRRGWEYPGGVVEVGERLEEALRREILEGTGVTVDIVGFVGICKNVKLDIINIDFRCTYISGELKKSDECMDIKWVSKEEAVNMVEYELTKKRLAYMLKEGKGVHCFAFSKTPFTVYEDDIFNV